VKIEIAFSLSSTSWFDVCPCGLNPWANNKPPSSRQDDLKMIEKSSLPGPKRDIHEKKVGGGS
jgi:hypothetical protein